MEYRVVLRRASLEDDESVAAFEGEVVSLLNDGFQLWGAPAISIEGFGVVVLQHMIKQDDEKGVPDDWG